MDLCFVEDSQLSISLVSNIFAQDAGDQSVFFNLCREKPLLLSRIIVVCFFKSKPPHISVIPLLKKGVDSNPIHVQ